MEKARRLREQQRVEPHLRERMLDADDDELRVIATFSRPVGRDLLAVLRQGGLRVRAAYGAVPAVAAVGPGKAVEVLAKHPAIEYVQPDRLLTYHLQGSVKAVQANPGVWKAHGIRGTGVNIAVVDTGIDTRHTDLPRPTKVIENVKLLDRSCGRLEIVNSQAPNTDIGGHGTHVAGIAGAMDGNGHEFPGVAPGAGLIGVSVGEGPYVSNAAAGLDWVWRNAGRLGIRVATNSWGPKGGSDYHPKDIVSRLTHRLFEAGVVVVFAVGNDGPGQNTLSGHAMSPYALGVTAYDDDNAQLYGSASRGVDEKGPLRPKDGTQRRPDLAAPGVGILAPAAMVAKQPGVTAQEHVPKSGTSMAAPHVAGAAALVWEAFAIGGVEAGPRQVMEVLCASADPDIVEVGNRGARIYEQGHGALDALEAVRRVRGKS